MAVKRELSIKEFELLCKKVYKTFLNHLDDIGKKVLEDRFGRQDNAWKNFFYPQYMYEDGYKGISLQGDFEKFIREHDMKNESDEDKLSHSAYLMTRYFYEKCRIYRRILKSKKEESITIGGSNLPKQQHYGNIFFRYIGVENYDGFIKTNLPHDANTRDSRLDFYASLFGRKNEWNRTLWEQLEGKWRVEVLEDEIKFNPDPSKSDPPNIYLPPGETLDTYLKNISKDDLTYEFRRCYWLDVHLEKSDTIGFLFAKGFMESDLMEGEDEITNWAFRALISIRSTYDFEHYLSFDFDLIPNSKSSIHKRMKTFGHGMLVNATPRSSSTWYQGFYMSNRRRVPKGENDLYADKRFKTAIAVGRCTFFRPKDNK